MKWLPIETAPQDGTYILVLDFSAGERWDVVGAFYKYGSWYTDWQSSDDGQVWPTHWMPLPEPPK